MAPASEFRSVLLVYPRAACALCRRVLPVPNDLCNRVFPACQRAHAAAGGPRQQLGVLRSDLRHAFFRTARGPARTSRTHAELRHPAPTANLRGTRAHESQSLGLHRHDGHQLRVGAGSDLARHDAHRRAAPSGNSVGFDHADSGARHGGVEPCCGQTRRHRRRRIAESSRLRRHAGVLLPVEPSGTALRGAAVAPGDWPARTPARSGTECGAVIWVRTALVRKREKTRGTKAPVPRVFSDLLTRTPANRYHYAMTTTEPSAIPVFPACEPARGASTDGSHSKPVLQHREIERAHERPRAIGNFEALFSSVPRSFLYPLIIR